MYLICENVTRCHPPKGMCGDCLTRSLQSTTRSEPRWLKCPAGTVGPLSFSHGSRSIVSSAFALTAGRRLPSLRADEDRPTGPKR